MVINSLGVIAAVTAFLSIWVGHVSVRKMEARAVRLWTPMVILFLLGIAIEIIALSLNSRTASMVLGITGINVLWSVLELKRQAGRVRKGHAPANPANPRHAAMLREPGSQATRSSPLDSAPTRGEMEAEQV